MGDSLVGLIPAGGQAERLAPLPCSKELLPIGFRQDAGGQQRPKLAGHYLLEKIRAAGATKTYIVLRPGKWDIPAYFGDGSLVDMPLAYLTVHVPFGVPYTIDQAYPFVHNELVAFGFPDIVFDTENAFCRLVERHAASQADVVLGLFETAQPQACDMVELDHSQRVQTLHIKPSQTGLQYTWAIAVWTPRFTRFLHEYVTARHKHQNANQYANQDLNQDPKYARPQASDTSRELSLGHILQAALHAELRIDGVAFPGDACLDIGTPANLATAMRAKLNTARTDSSI